MPLMRRARGAMLRLVRRRALATGVGMALIAPAVWVQCGATNPPWWLEGLGLVVGATGLAIVWTGLTGPSPDWME